jgi:ketosteroid isomerase-like protein
LPGESVYAPKTSMRQEFLIHAFEEVKVALESWQKRVREQDLKDLKTSFADDAIFAPLEGWIARGKAEIGDSLASYLPRLSAFGLVTLDFDASAGLAYVFGTAHYQIGLPGRNDRKAVAAEVVIILVQRGPSWRVRSYVERPDLSAGAP